MPWRPCVARNTPGGLDRAGGQRPRRPHTLPIAGLTALRVLRRLGPLVGRRVLVTGATGGVGRFAVQLAHRAGARVVAATSDPATFGDTLRELGADEVVDRPAAMRAGVDGVVDQVGGPVLVEAFRALAAHGTLVAVGHSSGVGESLAYGDLFGNGGRHDRSIVTFYLGDTGGFAADLTWLAEQVTTGSLDASPTWRGGLDRAEEAVRALLERRLHGKAVLDID